MGKPLFLVENLLSPTQFSAHVITASGELTGYERWRVATGRRSVRDRWSSSPAGAAAWIRVVCSAQRTVDTLALDRGHNLAGKQVVLERSTDNFVGNVTTVADMVIPAAAGSGASIDAANGVTTEEGAFLKRFAPATSQYWRLRIPNPGAGLSAELVGVWLGASWTPELEFDLPWGDDSIDLRYQAVTTEAGWLGTGRTARPRTGTIVLKLRSEAEYTLARYHVRQQFWRPRPMWIVYDVAAAERAVLAFPPPGRLGFERDAGWGHRQARLDWVEHEPRLE